MRPRIKRGDCVWFYWSASDCLAVTFIRWEVGRRHCGGADSNKLGVCAVVESNWCFDKCIVPRIPHGLRRGQYRLRPYTDVFKRRPYGYGKRGRPLPVARPTVKRCIANRAHIRRAHQGARMKKQRQRVRRKVTPLVRKLAEVTCCWECPFHYFLHSCMRCRKTKKAFRSWTFNRIPRWCPLPNKGRTFDAPTKEQG